MDSSELRRGIGYVIQQAGLFPHRTVVDNIATVPRAARAGTSEGAGSRAGAAGTGRAAGRSSPTATRSQLSGGQQQRVGVARALAADPPVMLMDEPFSAVDPVVREQLQDEFLRLQGELGKTIVFVTHDIDEAVKLGDQVAVLRVGGKLAQLGRPGAPARRTRPTTSWPTSSAETGATADWVSGRFPSCRLRAGADGAPGCHQGRGGRSGRLDDWLLVTDENGQPARLGRASPGSRAPSSPRGLHRGGTLAPVDGTLRSALDAALSSPSRPRRDRRRRRERSRARCWARGASPPSRAPRVRRQRTPTGGRTVRHDLVHRPPRRRAHPHRQARLAGRVPLILGLIIAIPLGWLARRYRCLYPPLIIAAPGSSTRSRRWLCSS